MMKRILKIVGGILLVAVAIGAGGFCYLYFRHPAMAPPENITVDKSPGRIERGRYIFTVLSDCEGCHSERDFTRLGGPAVESGRGMGGEMPLAGLPGRVFVPNITPDVETGIGSWTDGEKIRAIREGVDKNGRTLFPMMPYENFRYMSDEDVQSVVAYLDSLPPVHHPLPVTQIDFPVSMFIKSAPKPAGHVPSATPKPDAGYGEYLVTLANCETCHTPQVNGQPDTSLRFAGGWIFKTPMGTVASANITPDEDTGIGKWDYTRFHDTLTAYRKLMPDLPQVGPDRFTLMPWISFSNLTDVDLEAIYQYIHTRTPIPHKVNTHPAI